MKRVYKYPPLLRSFRGGQGGSNKSWWQTIYLDLTKECNTDTSLFLSPISHIHTSKFNLIMFLKYKIWFDFSFQSGGAWPGSAHDPGGGHPVLPRPRDPAGRQALHKLHRHVVCGLHLRGAPGPADTVPGRRQTRYNIESDNQVTRDLSTTCRIIDKWVKLILRATIKYLIPWTLMTVSK